MTQFPEPSAYPPTNPYSPSWAEPASVRTSGLAIASVILGSIGLFTCCFAVPSLMAIVFAAVALPAIGRGEVKGRGLAIVGLIFGIIGLLVGIVIWTLVILSPDNAPVAGREISAKDRSTLERLGVVEPGEEIELFCPTGTFTLKEGGVAITTTRLVVYSKHKSPNKVSLTEIKSIDFTPGEGFIGDGQWLVTLEDGSVVTFSIGSQDKADTRFHKVLREKVTQARESVGKTVVLKETQAEKDEDEAEEPPARPSPSSHKRH